MSYSGKVIDHFENPKNVGNRRRSALDIKN